MLWGSPRAPHPIMLPPLPPQDALIFLRDYVSSFIAHMGPPAPPLHTPDGTGPGWGHLWVLEEHREHPWVLGGGAMGHIWVLVGALGHP